MRYNCCVLTLVLAGCTSFSVFDAELPKYGGRPVDALADKLGFPDAEQTIMGRKVYIWSTSSSYVSFTPTTSTTTGYVGSQPVSATTTGYTATSKTIGCEIRAVVGASGLVERIGYDGNNGPCFAYANMLKR